MIFKGWPLESNSNPLANAVFHQIKPLPLQCSLHAPKAIPAQANSKTLWRSSLHTLRMLHRFFDLGKPPSEASHLGFGNDWINTRPGVHVSGPVLMLHVDDTFRYITAIETELAHPIFALLAAVGEKRMRIRIGRAEVRIA